MTKTYRLSASVLAFALVQVLSTGAAQAEDTDYHAEPDVEIVVTGAVKVSRKDVLSGVAVLTGADLAENVRPSLGETLAQTPGVSATSFGPNASRPVLRGMQGERVRLLSNGIGSIDASNTSADHAPAINPLLAQRIEVLRGPQSLQYGSAAIGGVVNVIDRRVPTTVPDEPIHFAALADYGSAANERSLSASADVRLGGGWVGHIDGSWSKTGDLRIPGYALTPELRAEALASSLLPGQDIDFAANAAVEGKLPNSAGRTWSFATGIGYINDQGSIGVAYSRLDNRYGIPIRYATQPDQEQEAPTIALKQDRIDAQVALNLSEGLLDRMTFRYAYADYRHAELEEDGAVGTQFFNKGMEGRLELAQNERGGWSGASGLQFVFRDFSVVGEEAFLPANTTSNFGLFTVQQLQRGPLRLEAGLRFEHSVQTATPDSTQPQFYSGERRFDAISASVGGAYDVAPGWKIGLSLSQTERAPAAEELFANGPHKGTETYEVGNPALVLERARSVEAILRGSGDGYDIELSAYHSWFDNYIYEAHTGAFEDGLPVIQIGQADARLYGFEVQGSLVLARPGVWTIKAEGLADYVHTTIVGVGPAPRIPPFRVKGGLKAESPHLELGAEVERVTAQNRVAAYETVTPGYTLVNLSLSWRPWGALRPLTIFAAANNLFDVEARRHASFLKDYAPLAGRDLRVGARVEF